MKEIKQYTKEQERLLNEDEFNYKLFNNIMDNKQIRIDKIVEIDDGFVPMFERVKGILNSQPKLYQQEIKKMQQLIQRISDISVNIQASEQKNKLLFDNKIVAYKKQVKIYRNNKSVVTNYYDNIKKQNKSNGSVFFDSKK